MIALTWSLTFLATCGIISELSRPWPITISVIIYLLRNYLPLQRSLIYVPRANYTVSSFVF